ncbi:uncharacterized protein LOC143223074 isoform X2 [Tachypleus tridentatus]|uniref:uncharacterized protein LOC143223074 isoform X2 n=1 Tax=Tachypleus tridentatus TaxID=6853 RepID=UPI003FCF71D1
MARLSCSFYRMAWSLGLAIYLARLVLGLETRFVKDHNMVQIRISLNNKSVCSDEEVGTTFIPRGVITWNRVTNYINATNVKSFSTGKTT